MTNPNLDLYTDYLLSTFDAATAAGLSAMVEGEVSHDQVTRFLSAQESTSKDLWQSVKRTVRALGSDDGVLTSMAPSRRKPGATRASGCAGYFDHCSGRTVKGINLLNALYHCNGTSIAVAFDLSKSPVNTAA